MKKTKIVAIGNILNYSVLILGGFVVVYPLIFMFLASFFTAQEYNSTLLTLLPIAKNPTLKNILFFLDGGTYTELGRYFMNSVLRTVVFTFGTIVSTLVCGYVFARLRFPCKKTIFFGLLFVSMMPATMSTIPTYLMYAKWPFTGTGGILNTWLVYYIGLPAINILGTFFVKQFMDTVPYSLDEAAKVDGTGTLKIISAVITPVCKPAIAYIGITTALSIWNDWATGFFFCSDNIDMQMLPTMISQIAAKTSSGSLPDYPQMLTIGLVMTIPSLIIYAVFQKNIVQCVATAGIKG